MNVTKFRSMWRHRSGGLTAKGHGRLAVLTAAVAAFVLHAAPALAANAHIYPSGADKIEVKSSSVKFYLGAPSLNNILATCEFTGTGPEASGLGINVAKFTGCTEPRGGTATVTSNATWSFASQSTYGPPTTIRLRLFTGSFVLTLHSEIFHCSITSEPYLAPAPGDSWTNGIDEGFEQPVVKAASTLNDVGIPTSWANSEGTCSLGNGQIKHAEVSIVTSQKAPLVWSDLSKPTQALKFGP
jgi:hypothetical protein